MTFLPGHPSKKKKVGFYPRNLYGLVLTNN